MNEIDASSSFLLSPQPGRRRRFSTDEKRRILGEANAPGESISSVGRRYGLSVSLLFRWRRALDGRVVAEAVTRDGSKSVLRAEIRRLKEQVREAERLLGKKILENETLRAALETAKAKRPAARASRGGGDMRARDGSA